jgi:gamma-glutamyltranspeptidase/glutathione hydrolase
MPRFKHGIVVAAHPLAAKAGLDILKKGGNAIDAASAAALALGVVTPAFCGIGGGGFALIRLAQEDKAIFVDYRERAPGTAKEEMFRLSRNGKVVRSENSVGYRAVAVPSCVAGHSFMLEKFGNISLKDVLEPAAQYARRGFKVSKVMADVLNASVSKLRSFKISSAIYLRRGGKPFHSGDRIRLKDLANSLNSIANNGPREFYDGSIAKKIYQDVASNNGLLSQGDLGNFRPTVREPVRGTYKNFEIISAPPPSSGGVIILQTLNMLENYRLKELSHNSTQALHLISEALIRSYANCRPKICDPDFSEVPADSLISKDFARDLSSTITLDAASVASGVADLPKAPTSSTSHLSVIDREGNAVALTESVECYFGSGVVVPRTGILLNDTMHDFDPRPGQPNSVGAGKIPMSSMCPTIVMKDGKPLLAAGSAGATRIVSSTFQTVLNILEFGMSVEEAVAAPRIHTQDRLVQAESRIPHESVNGLRSMGHVVQVKHPSDVSRITHLYFGGVHAAFVRPDSSELEGGADPRRQGAALGY